MAFHLSVYRKSDLPFVHNPPSDVHSEEFDQWMDEANSRTLYENPLGSDGTVYEYWSGPAVNLGLPLIASIYNNYLEVPEERLQQLEDELVRLEEYWKSLDLSSMEDLAENLRESTGYLREAISIARANDGVVTIV